MRAFVSDGLELVVLLDEQNLAGVAQSHLPHPGRAEYNLAIASMPQAKKNDQDGRWVCALAVLEIAHLGHHGLNNLISVLHLWPVTNALRSSER